MILHNITRRYQNLFHAFPWPLYAPNKNPGHSPRKAMPCFSATLARGSVWWMWRNNPTRPREGGGCFSATPHSMPYHPGVADLCNPAPPRPPAEKPPGELARCTGSTQHKPPALENTTSCLNDILKSAGGIAHRANKRKQEQT